VDSILRITNIEIPISEMVVPILALNKDIDNRPTPLGTGFFVEHEGPLLVTCAHVLEDFSGRLVIAPPATLPNMYFADVIDKQLSTDLALLKVPTYDPQNVLELSQIESFIGNQLVACPEYSQTRRIEGTTNISCASRVGNITRSMEEFDLSFLGRKSSGIVKALELSFPGLRGASGAPVLNRETLEVLGIVAGNVQYELLPVQVDIIYDDQGNKEEEHKYMLPQGIAIHVAHLRDLLKSL